MTEPVLDCHLLTLFRILMYIICRMDMLCYLLFVFQVNYIASLHFVHKISIKCGSNTYECVNNKGLAINMKAVIETTVFSTLTAVHSTLMCRML